MGEQTGANDRHVFDCKCGVTKRCPELRREPDGVVLHEDDDALVALEAPRRGVRLTAAQASELRAKLEEWGF